MSIILDALKKLDRERAAKRQGTMNIAAAILTQDGTRRRRILVPVAAVLFAALAAAAAAYYWTGMTPQQSVAVQTVPATGQASGLQPVSPAAKPEPAAEPKQAPSMEPDRKRVAAPAPPAALAPAPAERSRKKATAAAEPARAPEKSVGVSTAGRSKLKVSGIVWQEERSARRAFVNDVPMREGDMVQGAKIVEIHPGHVRFSRDGESFDVRLFE